MPVRADFAPNVTFSVAYVKDGDYVFQNQGLKVAQPRVEVAVRPDKRGLRARATRSRWTSPRPAAASPSRRSLTVAWSTR